MPRKIFTQSGAKKFCVLSKFDDPENCIFMGKQKYEPCSSSKRNSVNVLRLDILRESTYGDDDDGES